MKHLFKGGAVISKCNQFRSAWGMHVYSLKILELVKTCYRGKN